MDGVGRRLASLIARSYVQQTWGGDINIGREQNPERADWRHQTTSLSLDALNTFTSEGAARIRFQRYTGWFEHREFLGKSVYLNTLLLFRRSLEPIPGSSWEWQHY